MKQFKTMILPCLCIFTIIGIFSYSLLTVIYHNDNKYYGNQALVKNGTLKVQETMWVDDTCYSLVDNWKFFPHQAVYPNDPQQTTYEYTYIGQYPDYSQRKKEQSPYGISTYQLRFINEGEPQTLSIYFPELDTAAQVYINDQLQFEHGNLNTTPMTSYIKNRNISFYLDQEVEITVIVGNDTHYYSGMYFPPVLSTTQGIQNMIAKKLIFYGFLCFSSLSLALYSFNLWLRVRKDPIFPSLGCATLCYAIFLTKEFWKMYGITHVTLFYAVIDLFYFLMLYDILALNSYLSHTHQTKLYRNIVKPISIGICILAFLSFLFLSNENLLSLYGNLIDFYKLGSMIYIIYTSYRALARKEPLSYWLLCANIFYVCGILYTLLFANIFEPMCFGWPNEYFSFFIILSLALLMIQRNSMIIKENEAYNLHLGQLVDEKTKQLSILLNERKVMLNEFAHDLKAPISSMQSFITLIREENIHVDHEVEEYLSIIERKSSELQERMALLSKFSHMDCSPEHKENIELKELLQQFYETIKPDCDAEAIYLNLELCEEACIIYADAPLLQRVLENLVYNAISFTPSNGHITMTLKNQNDHAVISICDDGCGIPQDQQALIFQKGVSLRKGKQSERGLGLYIVKSIITQHNGTIEVSSDGKHGTIFHLYFPLAKKVI